MDISIVQGFQIRSRPTPPANVVVISGDADHAAAAAIERALEVAAEGSPPAVVIELTDATFIDSSVLELVLRTVRNLRSRGVPCAVVCDPQHIMRVFAPGTVN